MPFVKDSSYREMPISLEIANEDYHEFLSLKKLVAKITKHQHTVFQCTSIGILSSQSQGYTLCDIDDSSIEIRVSLRYMKTCFPYAGRPFTAHVLGFVHWFFGAPVLYAISIKDVFPPVAQKLLSTMEWIVNNHKMVNPERRRKRRPAETITAASTNPIVAYQPENVQMVAPGEGETDQMEHDLMQAIEANGQVVLHVQMEPIGPVAFDEMTYEEIEASALMCDNYQALPILTDMESNYQDTGQMDQMGAIEQGTVRTLPYTIDHMRVDRNIPVWPTDPMRPFLTALPMSVPGVCLWCNYNFIQTVKDPKDPMEPQHAEENSPFERPSDVTIQERIADMNQIDQCPKTSSFDPECEQCMRMSEQNHTYANSEYDDGQRFGTYATDQVMVANGERLNRSVADAYANGQALYRSLYSTSQTTYANTNMEFSETQRGEMGTSVRDE
ncbi:uncharacterized protein LOC133528953 [Cydia pomonella]|uniref:uncharacterized protein LOC133528953 n=1 Tax=Cydia pomonella TaxID=82600 RepID=UPI002ADE0D1E|nr:uncharacterized protein LOC133528953 [Cydia pomonella]